MLFQRIAFLVLLHLLQAHGQDEGSCKPGSLHFYQYCFATVASSHQGACSEFQNGAHPVIIRNEETQQFLASDYHTDWAEFGVPNISHYRIGLNQTQDGGLVWWDGTTVDYALILEDSELSSEVSSSSSSSAFSSTSPDELNADSQSSAFSPPLDALNADSSACFAFSITDDFMWIRYDCADEIGVGTLCQYECVNCYIDCGETSVFTAPTGVYETFEFDVSWGLDAEILCHWTIHLPQGKFIELTFTNFDIAKELDGDRCWDIVAVVPGGAPSWFNPLLDEVAPGQGFCGYKPPGVTLTSVSTLSIVLATGYWDISYGLQFEYVTKDIPGCSVGAAIIEHNLVTCDAVEYPRAKFASLDFPNLTPAGLYHWTIQSEPFTFTRVRVIEFNLPDPLAVCNLQYLRTDFDNQKYCDANPPPAVIESYSNVLSIDLLMLDIGRGNGFLAEYEVVRYAPTSNFSVSSIPVDEDNWYQYNDFLYKFFEENAALNWLEAEGLCSERSSHLVSIHNQQEAEFLHTMQQIVWRVNRPATHIGLTAKSTTGIFRWSDGSPMVYTDWMQLPERQPDGDLVESCTMIDMTNYRTTALWHDIPCAQTRESTSQYICKKPSPDAAPREKIKQTVSKDTVMECSKNFNLIQCGNQECTHKLFGCTNETERGGSSIPSTWQKVTALDPGQDACPSSFFQCGTGDCIPISFVCDFVPHCIDSTDEKRCDYRNCTDGEFRCDNGQCVEAWRHCDLTVDCIDGTDESNCDESASGFRCFDGRFIPLGAVCDRAYDCQGGLHEDEDGCPTWGDSCEMNEIQCKSGLCVSEQHRCIYDIDKYGYVTGCPDVTHLGDCGSFACPEMYFHCPEAHCIPPRFRCDQKTDCPHGEDEIDCDDYTCPGAYRCHGASYCLHLSKVCDSVNDCPDGDDELFCGLPCPAGCECTGLEYACDIRGYQLDSSAEIPSIARSIKLEGQPIRDVEGILRRGRRTTLGMNAELDEWFPINMSRYHMLTKLEIISVGIECLPQRIFDQNPNLIYIDLSDNNIAVLRRGSFQGLDSLRHLRLLFNPLTFIEDGAFMGLANLEILNIYATEPEKFSTEILIDLSGLQTLYAGEYLFCCIAVDTLRECLAPRDQFSSCKDLMKNPVLRVSIWILGISAFLGNFLVVVFRSMALYKGRDGSPIQTFFIANLAVSDFLMGAYMIIIGSADLYYREVYALRKEAWKASFTCKFGGFLSVVSSQASVLMVTLLSLDRCAHIVFPFKKALHLRPRSSRIAVGLLWVVAVLIAALPLLITPYFNDNFYGRSSVCLALPLTVELQPGYEYMFFILGVNFVCFLLILFTYLAIFVTVKRSSSKVKSSKAAADVKLAGKMAFIIGTDFACWMPIIIMAVLASAGGISIPPEIYAWTAVFILPLNSSINPYLYTISTYSSSKKTKGPATSNSTGVASVSSAVSPITKVQMDPEYLDQRNNSIIALLSLPLRPTSNNNTLPLPDHDKDQNTDNKTSGTSSDPATQPQEENFYVEMQDLVECERNKLTAGDISVIGADLKKALSWLHSRNVTRVDMREELIVLEKKTDGRNKAYLLVPEAKLRNKGEKATDDEKDKDKRKLEVLLNKLTASTLA